MNELAMLGDLVEQTTERGVELVVRVIRAVGDLRTNRGHFVSADVGNVAELAQQTCFWRNVELISFTRATSAAGRTSGCRTMWRINPLSAVKIRGSLNLHLASPSDSKGDRLVRDDGVPKLYVKVFVGVAIRV